ncbi:MAG: methyltransferase domain-containing protein [Deltaproteobacteria bacterium]|nr:methyltransferase domain-containing protein [Deltaproteobacteria bacterium]
MIHHLTRILHLVAGDMPMRRQSLDASMVDYWEQRQRTDATMARRRARIARRMESVAEEIEDGSTVLEIGCGSGDLLDVIRGRRPNCSLKGIDLSPEAVQVARTRGFDVEQRDVMSLDPNATDPVDFIVLSEVLEHLSDPETVLMRCGSIARRRIIVTIPNVAFVLHRIRLGLFGKFPVTTVFHIREHLSLWSVSDFLFWADRIGFRVVSTKGFGGVTSFGMNELWPNLLATQALYVLERKERDHGSMREYEWQP